MAGTGLLQVAGEFSASLANSVNNMALQVRFFGHSLPCRRHTKRCLGLYLFLRNTEFLQTKDEKIAPLIAPSP